MIVKIGLIGCGAIGTTIAKAVEKGLLNNFTITAIFDLCLERAKELNKILSSPPFIASTFNSFLQQPLDLVIEAASPKAVEEYAEEVLLNHNDLMIMSVGALLKNGLLKRLEEVAHKQGCRIYIPSGAIAGIDAIKAATLGGIEEVIITTRKRPESLKGAPYLEKKGIDLKTISSAILIYEGPAEEAVMFFPANVNVAAVLSLAGIGPKKTKVRVIADPHIDTNQHEIKVKGDFGEMVCLTANFPCPDNPKTSYLAALSAIKTLEETTKVVRIGT
ncbi:MAG: aspartate dehydrogenase [Candidatus Desulfofervidaceae bacterium]|nr:aspartate dehydrogenase [Candidatus Desulfofervidaceae bacterium]